MQTEMLTRRLNQKPAQVHKLIIIPKILKILIIILKNILKILIIILKNILKILKENQKPPQIRKNMRYKNSSNSELWRYIPSSAVLHAARKISKKHTQNSPHTYAKKS